MTNRWIPLTLGAATMVPYGLLGGFGPGDAILPWIGMLAGWIVWVLVAREGVRRGWWLVAHDADRSSVSPYFKLLGLSPTATTADVKHAFRKQAWQHHPGGDAAKFRELVEAKEHALEGLGVS
jgi:hypothetical protein